MDVGRDVHDAVLLGDDLVARRLPRFVRGEFAGLLLEHGPDVVAIDAPPFFSPRAEGRRAERALHACGIKIFFCPTAERAEGNAFYDWMRTGFALFAEAAASGYPLGLAVGQLDHTAIEVFPTPPQ